jgi:hypothetical protein
MTGRNIVEILAFGNGGMAQEKSELLLRRVSDELGARI